MSPSPGLGKGWKTRAGNVMLHPVGRIVTEGAMGLLRKRPGKHDRQPPLPPHLGETGEEPGRDYVYERDQLLADGHDVDRVMRLARELDGVKIVDSMPVGSLDVTRLHVRSRKLAIPDLVDALREGGGPDLRVAPNHVLGRASHVSMLSVTPPRPATERPALYEEPGLPGQGTRVGVLDTGAWDHPYFAGRCDFRDPADLDEPDADGDKLLDYAAGHGTFIAGIVLQHAPRATVVARRLPSDDTGPAPHQDYVSDTQLATALEDLPELREVDVLSLAVGGYTHDGLGLVATEAVLHDFLAGKPDLVVVAGAGNEGSSEPYFPAAMKQVIGVAALDVSAERRACFSNYGSWVDACAPGVDAHSTFLEWDQGLAPYPRPLPEACDGLLDVTPEPGVEGFRRWARWDGTSFAAPRVAAAIAARISAGRSGPEAAFDVLHAPGTRRLPLLGTVVNPRTYP
jgi:subtilisin family serine protease